MRCLVSARAFRKRLAAVAAVIPRRCTKPILETVRLEIDERGRGTLFATDLATWVRVRVPILRVIRGGAAQLPPRALAAILGGAGNRDVELDADPQAFALTCGVVDQVCPLVITGQGLRSTLSSPRPEDYPTREEPPDTGHHVLARRDLARLIRTTSFAVDPACTRYQLGGCWFGLGEDSVDVVATDGCRLSHAWKRGIRVVGTPPAPAVRRTGDRSSQLATVVGAGALRVLLRLLDESKGPLEAVGIDWTPDGYFRVRSGDLCFSSRQLEGRFPEWHSAFPPPSPHRGHFTRTDRLLSILKRAAALAGRDRPRIQVGLEPGKLTLVTVADTAVERFETYCDYRAEPSGAVFDAEQLIDVLSVLGGETVDLELNGPGVPGVIHAAGLRYCVMPLDPQDSPRGPAGAGSRPPCEQDDDVADLADLKTRSGRPGGSED